MLEERPEESKEIKSSGEKKKTQSKDERRESTWEEAWKGCQ